jgi:VanZ family protein
MAYMAGVFWLSSQSIVPGAGLMPEWLDRDWLHHGVAYAGLALVTLRAAAGGRRSGIGVASVTLAWLIVVAYGATDEWHQSFVPGRTADLRDVAADGAGAALGLGVAWAWSMIRRSP